MLFTQKKVELADKVFILVHGMGATVDRWQDFVQFLSEHKISSYCLEVQGYSNTTGPRGHVTSFRQYTDDLHELITKAKEENPGKPIYLIGESLGGLISLSYLLKHPMAVQGLIPIVPALMNIMKVPVGRILLFSLFKPTHLIDMPFTPEMITHDEEIISKLKADKREIAVASARLNLLIQLEMIKVLFSAKKFQVPMLILSSGEDKLVSTKMQLYFFKKLKCHKKHRLYPELKHALTIEKDRQQVFKDILDWVELF